MSVIRWQFRKPKLFWSCAKLKTSFGIPQLYCSTLLCCVGVEGLIMLSPCAIPSGAGMLPRNAEASIDGPNVSIVWLYVCVEQAMAVGTPPLLAGRASRDIMLQVERLHPADHPRERTIELFSRFFAVSDTSTVTSWSLVIGSAVSQFLSLPLCFTEQLTRYEWRTEILQI